MEEERSLARAATLAELERANTALTRVLDENVTLQAHLLRQALEAGIVDERRRLAAGGWRLAAGGSAHRPAGALRLGTE